MDIDCPTNLVKNLTSTLPVLRHLLMDTTLLIAMPLSNYLIKKVGIGCRTEVPFRRKLANA